MCVHLEECQKEKGSCKNIDSSAPWRDRLKEEVVEVYTVVFPNSILLQPLKCKRKLSSAYHVANLESITSEGDNYWPKV